MGIEGRTLELMLSSYAYDSPIKPSTLHITSVCSLELQL